MARTRHRSTAVQSYKRPSDELLQKVTKVLQTPKSPIASGEEVESNEVVAKKKCVNKDRVVFKNLSVGGGGASTKRDHIIPSVEK